MKKTLLLLFILSVANIAFAQVTPGYYRVQNNKTERYIRVTDNRGSIDIASTTADLGALETKRYFENVVSDPASIIYITPKGDGYDFECQGTTFYSIIGYYTKLLKNRDGSYKAYVSHKGMTKYLNDEYFEGFVLDEGVVLTNGRESCDWYIKPVNQAEGQYFALTPTVTAEGNHYTSFYAAFPFTLPAGMTAYYVKIVDGDQAVWEEVKDGKVPASTAVYVKCKSNNYADNKVTIGENGAAPIAGNLMKGVYFNNGSKKHNNQLAYNPNTMRVLGTMSNGKLGFITADIDFIPANTAYLEVPENSPAEIKLVYESEYSPSIAVQSVSLSQTSLIMYVGDTQTLTAKVLPEDATYKSLKWSSSNNDIATVDANGVVKAIANGKATITVSSSLNSAIKTVCEVTVKAKSYALTYIVDGQIFATDSITHGSEIILREEPTKEGHTFSGWSDTPKTMPAKDIAINGTFTANKYTVTYIINGEVYKTQNVTFGTEIPTLEEPTKEGYTFSGWSDTPKTMPAKDITINGTFTANKYTVTYIIDGEVYKTQNVTFGTEIPTLEEPTKDGRQFSGWSKIPSTMPAKDITIEGKFQYTIIFMLDGKYFYSLEAYYGSNYIETPSVPQKEGHTFVGWSNFPETMPARDFTTHAMYDVNKYQLIFIIDGEVYETLYLEYDSKIEYPQETGDIIEWDMDVLPETMPAENLIIVGKSIVETAIDAIKIDCKKDVIYTLDGHRIFDEESLKKGIYIINGKKVYVK